MVLRWKLMDVFIHYLDPITHQLRIELKPGEFERISFEDVVGVVVLD
ncbi:MULTISPECIES: hypothetical protein [Bacillaceae]